MPYPVLTRDQVRRLDQTAIEKYGIPGIVLMENAGRGLAEVLSRETLDGPVVICCGKGNNAGDGFVLARHLDLRGHSPLVLLWADPSQLHGDAETNYHILRQAEIPIEIFGDSLEVDRLQNQLTGAAWIVDALLGTGAVGQPRAPLDAVIDQINAADAPVLAVDVPSGLDCDTGKASSPTIRAQRTCTFAAAKPGLVIPDAEPYVGQLHILDIGTPRRLLDEIAHHS